MTELSRERVLAGLHGRRSSVSLLAIQSRTALLALRARHATSPPVGDALLEGSERSFLGALAAGRDLPVTPTIFDLERHADGWSDLVPQHAAARADLFAQLTRSYRFGWNDIPRIRRVLQLDDPHGATATAWAARHAGAPQDAPQPSSVPLDRWRWLRVRAAARVDGLPPMVTVMALMLCNTIGASILALPIAVSAIGPLGGLIPLVALGIVNIATAAAMAEGFARTGRVHWGNGYFRRVVEEYFGRRVASFGVSVLVAFALVATLAYYIGVGSTLEDAIGLPSAVWAALLGAVALWYAGRRDVASTAVTAIAIVTLNLAIIAVIVGLAIPSVTGDNLRLVSPFDGGLDTAVIETVLGIVLVCYGGQNAVVMSARAVMRRDPSGRSLIRGLAAAKLVALIVYVVWLLAIGGAIDPADLIGETGTVLGPLADVAGPVVLVLGVIYVVAAMGMGTVQLSVSLAGQATEWAPTRLPGRDLIGTAVAMLPCVAGVVLLATDRASFTKTLAIIGVAAVPVLAGLAPIGVLAASRRRGRYSPAGSVRWLGSPITAVLVIALYVGITAVHGLLIWDDPWQRATALIVTAVCCLVIWSTVRGDALRRLAVVELRREPLHGRTRLGIAASSEPAEGVIEVGPPGRRTDVTVAGETTLPVTVERVLVRDVAPDLDLTVWTHALDPIGMSRPLQASVVVSDDAAQAAVPPDAEGYAFVAGGRGRRQIDIVLQRGGI